MAADGAESRAHSFGRRFFRNRERLRAPATIPRRGKDTARTNVKSEVNSVALDYELGVGYQLAGGLSLGVRYDGGASNVFKSNSTTLGAGKSKTSTALVALGHSFGGNETPCMRYQK